MIRRETLMALRNASKKMDFNPDSRTVHMLIQAALELMDVVDGGNSHVRFERELHLGLDSLRQALQEGETHCHTQPTTGSASALVHFQKARYTVAVLDQMIRTKPDRRKPWAHYQEMVNEEFEEDR